jgi:hypothetical protein
MEKDPQVSCTSLTITILNCIASFAESEVSTAQLYNPVTSELTTVASAEIEKIRIKIHTVVRNGPQSRLGVCGPPPLVTFRKPENLILRIFTEFAIKTQPY